MDNKYVNRAKISESKFRELIMLFSLDLTATQIAKLSGLNRNTVNRYLMEIRKRLAKYCEITSPIIQKSCCSMELAKDDLRYLGIAEKRGMVCVRAVECDSELEEKEVCFGCSDEIILDLIVNLKNDRRIWQKSRSVLHKTDRSKLNRIEGFLGYAQTRMEKFKGIHNQTYFLHLKESEFRYNNDKDKLYYLILKIVRNNPLF